MVYDASKTSGTVTSLVSNVLQPLVAQRKLGIGSSNQITLVDTTTDLTNGGGGGGSGSGAYAYTITITASAVAVAGATVVMADGVNRYSATTNGSGVATFALDAATYTLTVSKRGYQHTPASVTVSAAGNTNATITAIVITPATDPDRTNGYVTVYDSEGQPLADATITVQLMRSADQGGGLSHYDDEISATSDGAGLAVMLGMLRQARYRAKRGDGGWGKPFVTADATTTPLPEILGHE